MRTTKEHKLFRSLIKFLTVCFAGLSTGVDSCRYRQLLLAKVERWSCVKIGLASVAFLICFGIAPNALLAASKKKGVAEHKEGDNGAKTLSELSVSWYYDWGPVPDISGVSSHIQFVPMIWGRNGLSDETLQAVKGTGARELLGFNEPNGKRQANMTVQEALDAWPKLEALNMRLGSPAPAGDATKPDGWLAQFMAGAKAWGYRVDFICIHPYISNFDPDEATKVLVQKATAVYNTYHLPVWITEYAMIKFDNGPNYPSVDVQAKFAEKSAAALDKLPFVERYAWFGDIPNWKSSLYNADGTPTPVGVAWAAAPSKQSK